MVVTMRRGVRSGRESGGGGEVGWLVILLKVVGEGGVRKRGSVP